MSSISFSNSRYYSSFSLDAPSYSSGSRDIYSSPLQARIAASQEERRLLRTSRHGISDRLDITQFLETTLPQAFEKQKEALATRLATFYGLTINKHSGNTWQEIENALKKSYQEENGPNPYPFFIAYDDLFARLNSANSEKTTRLENNLTYGYSWNLRDRMQQELRQIEAETELFAEFCTHATEHANWASRRSLPRGLGANNKGYGPDDIYLKQGVCKGACVDYAAQKLENPHSPITIQPTKRARFLQAGHDIANRFPNYCSSSISNGSMFLESDASSKEKCKVALQILANLALQAGDDEEDIVRRIKSIKSSEKLDSDPSFDTLLENLKKQIRDASDIESMKARKLEKAVLNPIKIDVNSSSLLPNKISFYEFILDLPLLASHTDNHTGHFIVSLTANESIFLDLDFEIRETAQNSALAQNLLLELAKIADLTESTPEEILAKLAELRGEKLDSIIATFRNEHLYEFWKKMVTNRLGDNAPELIVSQVDTNVFIEINDFLSNLAQKDRVKEEPHFSGHAIYISLKAPYEIQDPNVPGFAGFKTDDLHQFQRYLAMWSAVTPYTHVRELSEVTSTSKIGN